MGYTVDINDMQVIFEDEPTYCYSLQMSPENAESVILTGNWLVLVFALWSNPDYIAIETALEVVKHFHGKVSLGVRPFSDHSEIKVWCPDVNLRYGVHGSPLWLVLQDGGLKYQTAGSYKSEHLIGIVDEVLFQSSQH